MCEKMLHCEERTKRYLYAIVILVFGFGYVFWAFQTVRMRNLANDYCELTNMQSELINKQNDLISGITNATLTNLSPVPCPGRVWFWGWE